MTTGSPSAPSARPSFVHLDVRSYFSLREGAFSPEDLARRARALGMEAVALTDRDGLYGAARFAAACAREGVRPILGATLTVRTRPERARAIARGNERAGAPRTAPRTAPAFVDRRVVLLAKDAAGYANLSRLITAAHATGERGDPALTAGQVCERAAGLVCLLGPESEPGSLAAAGHADAAASALRPWVGAFGTGPDRDLFVAVRDLREQGSTAELRRLLALADAAGLPAVATNAVRHLVPEDAFLADVLECMRELVPLAEHHLSRRNAEGFLKGAAEMRALFAERPDLCDATLEVADRCRFDLRVGAVHFPEFPTPPGRSAGSVLAERCHRGMRERGMAPVREVRRRLDHELAQIRTMGYAAYFLTVADIVADIRAMGVRCACRGSAAASLVCHLTGISDVDPVRHGLLFERFLNPLRDELPDIDVDVESARREDVYDMILSRYGEGRCACVAMVDTYRARGAIREVGKALGLPEGEVGEIAKAFPHIGAGQVRAAMRELPELRGLHLDTGRLELLFRVVERLDGFPRHLALHPSGIVLAGDDLPDRVPLERSAQGYRMIQADKDDVELLGLLKLDVLGVRMLSAMRHALDEVVRVEDVKLDLGAIPTDDPATFELIRASDTIGCFQIESPGQRELLAKFQPTAWEDLIVDISLFRPGPVKSDMITPYLNRRHGREMPSYAHPCLRAALHETHGVIVYHEQVMRVLAEVGGYGMAEADFIRRHLGDDAFVARTRPAFLVRAAARGVPRATAACVWEQVAQFASFGFCKAHAAAFAVPTYQSAWLKAHHPAAFLAGVLTHDPGMYPKRLILEDARRHGIEILPLDVNASEREYAVEPVGPAEPSVETLTADAARHGIRIGLMDVAGISEAEIRSILAARAERPFADVGDVLRRTDVSRPVAEALAHAGAFDRLPGTSGSRRDRLLVAMTAEAPRDGEQLALPLASDATPGGSLREYTAAERVRAELEVTGLDASRHLLSFYEPLLADLGVVRARDLPRTRGDRWVMVAGVKVASQTPAVRSGQRIIFLTLDDGTGLADVTVFERAQPWCAGTIFHGFLLAVWGRLRRTGVGGASIIAERAFDLAELARARREGRLAETLTEGTTTAVPLPGPAVSRLRHASPGSAG